jgi:hypothetical protein
MGAGEWCEVSWLKAAVRRGERLRKREVTAEELRRRRWLREASAREFAVIIVII